MTDKSQDNNAPPAETSNKEEGNSSHDSMDCKAPNSIHNNSIGISNTVGTDISEARQLLLQLATDETADDHQKETLVSALRALDSALRALPLAVSAPTGTPTSASSNNAEEDEPVGAMPLAVLAPSESTLPAISNSADENESVGDAPVAEIVPSQDHVTAPSNTAVEVESREALPVAVNVAMEVESVPTPPVYVTVPLQPASARSSSSVKAELPGAQPSNSISPPVSSSTELNSIGSVETGIEVVLGLDATENAPSNNQVEGEVPAHVVNSQCCQLDSTMADVETKMPAEEKPVSGTKPWRRTRRGSRKNRSKKRLSSQGSSALMTSQAMEVTSNTIPEVQSSTSDTPMVTPCNEDEAGSTGTQPLVENAPSDSISPSSDTWIEQQEAGIHSEVACSKSLALTPSPPDGEVDVNLAENTLFSAPDVTKMEVKLVETPSVDVVSAASQVPIFEPPNNVAEVESVHVPPEVEAESVEVPPVAVVSALSETPISEPPNNTIEVESVDVEPAANVETGSTCTLPEVVSADHPLPQHASSEGESVVIGVPASLYTPPQEETLGKSSVGLIVDETPSETPSENAIVVGSVVVEIGSLESLPADGPVSFVGWQSSCNEIADFQPCDSPSSSGRKVPPTRRSRRSSGKRSSTKRRVPQDQAKRGSVTSSPVVLCSVSGTNTGSVFRDQLEFGSSSDELVAETVISYFPGFPPSNSGSEVELPPNPPMEVGGVDSPQVLPEDGMAHRDQPSGSNDQILVESEISHPSNIMVSKNGLDTIDSIENGVASALAADLPVMPVISPSSSVMTNNSEAQTAVLFKEDEASPPESQPSNNEIEIESIGAFVEVATSPLTEPSKANSSLIFNEAIETESSSVLPMGEKALPHTDGSLVLNQDADTESACALPVGETEPPCTDQVLVSNQVTKTHSGMSVRSSAGENGRTKRRRRRSSRKSAARKQSSEKDDIQSTQLSGCTLPVVASPVAENGPSEGHLSKSASCVTDMETTSNTVMEVDLVDPPSAAVGVSVSSLSNDIQPLYQASENEELACTLPVGETAPAQPQKFLFSKQEAGSESECALPADESAPPHSNDNLVLIEVVQGDSPSALPASEPIPPVLASPLAENGACEGALFTSTNDVADAETTLNTATEIDLTNSSTATVAETSFHGTPSNNDVEADPECELQNEAIAPSLVNPPLKSESDIKEDSIIMIALPETKTVSSGAIEKINSVEMGDVSFLALEKSAHELSSLDKDHAFLENHAEHLMDSQLKTEVVVEKTDQMQVERTGQKRKSRRSSRRSGTRNQRLSQHTGKLESVAAASSSAKHLATSNQATESGSLLALPVGVSGQSLSNSIQLLNQENGSESACALPVGETAPAQPQQVSVLSQVVESEAAFVLPVDETANQVADAETPCGLPMDETAPPHSDSDLVSNQVLGTESACALPMDDSAPPQCNSLLVLNQKIMESEDHGIQSTQLSNGALSVVAPPVAENAKTISSSAMDGIECVETGAVSDLAPERMTNEELSMEKHPGDHHGEQLMHSQLDTEAVVEKTDQLQVERTGQKRKSRRSSRRSGSRKQRLSQQGGKLESVAAASSSAEHLATSNQATESGSLLALPVGVSGQSLSNSVQLLKQENGTESACALPVGETAPAQPPKDLVLSQVVESETAFVLPFDETANQVADAETPCGLPVDETAPPHSDSDLVSNQVAGIESACALPVGETAPSQTSSPLVLNDVGETDSACEFLVGKTALSQSTMALNAGGEEKQPHRKRKGNDVEGEAVCVLQDEGIAPSQVNLPLMSSTSDIQVDSIIALPDAKTISSSAMDGIECVETGAVSDLAPERMTNEELSMEKHPGDHHGEQLVDSQLDTEAVVEKTDQLQVERTGQKRKSRRSSRKSGSRKQRLSQQGGKLESVAAALSSAEHLATSNQATESGSLLALPVGVSGQSLSKSVQLLNQGGTESACALPVGETAPAQPQQVAVLSQVVESEAAFVLPVDETANRVADAETPCGLPVDETAPPHSDSDLVSNQVLGTESACALPMGETAPSQSNSVLVSNEDVETDSACEFLVGKTARLQSSMALNAGGEEKRPNRKRKRSSCKSGASKQSLKEECVQSSHLPLVASPMAENGACEDAVFTITNDVTDAETTELAKSLTVVAAATSCDNAPANNDIESDPECELQNDAIASSLVNLPLTSESDMEDKLIMIGPLEPKTETIGIGPVSVLAPEETANELSSLDKHPGHHAEHSVDSQLKIDEVVEKTDEKEVDRTGQKRKSRRSSRRSGSRKQRLSQKGGKLESVAAASSSAEHLATSNQATESGSLLALPVGVSGQSLSNSVQLLKQENGTESACALPVGETAPAQPPKVLVLSQVVESETAFVLPFDETTNQVADAETPCGLPVDETAPPHSDIDLVSNQVAGIESACALPVGETAPSQTSSPLVLNDVGETDSDCEFLVGKTALLQSTMAHNAGGEEKRPHRKGKGNDVEGEAVCVLQDEGIAPSQVNLPLMSSTSDIQVDSMNALPDAKTISSSAMDGIECVETGAVSDLAPERMTNEELSMEKHLGDHHGEQLVDSQLDTEAVVEKTDQLQVERTGQKRKSRRSSRRSGSRKQRLSQQTGKLESVAAASSSAEHLTTSNQATESGSLLALPVGVSGQSLSNSVQLLNQENGTESACALPVGETAPAQPQQVAVLSQVVESEAAFVSPVDETANQVADAETPCGLPVDETAPPHSDSDLVSNQVLGTESACALSVDDSAPPQCNSLLVLNQKIMESEDHGIQSTQLSNGALSAVAPPVAENAKTISSSAMDGIECVETGAVSDLAPERMTNEELSMEKHPGDHHGEQLVDSQLDTEAVVEKTDQLQVERTGQKRKSRRSSRRSGSRKQRLSQQGGKLESVAAASSSAEHLATSNQATESGSLLGLPVGVSGQSLSNSIQLLNQENGIESACALPVGETAPAQPQQVSVLSQVVESEAAFVLPVDETANQVADAETPCGLPVDETAPPHSDSDLVSNQVLGTGSACALPMGETAPSQSNSVLVSNEDVETDSACEFLVGKTAWVQSSMALNAGGEEKRPNRKRKRNSCKSGASKQSLKEECVQSSHLPLVASPMAENGACEDAVFTITNDVTDAETPDLANSLTVVAAATSCDNAAANSDIESVPECELQNDAIASSLVNLPLTSESDMEDELIMIGPLEPKTETIGIGPVSVLAPEETANELSSLDKHPGHHAEHSVDSQLKIDEVVEKTDEKEVDRTGQKRKSRRSSRRSGSRKQRLSQKGGKLESVAAASSSAEHLATSNQATESGSLFALPVGVSGQSLSNSIQLLKQENGTESACALPVGETAPAQPQQVSVLSQVVESEAAVVLPVDETANQVADAETPCGLPVDETAPPHSDSDLVSNQVAGTNSACALPMDDSTPPQCNSLLVLNEVVEIDSACEFPEGEIALSQSGIEVHSGGEENRLKRKRKRSSGKSGDRKPSSKEHGIQSFSSKSDVQVEAIIAQPGAKTVSSGLMEKIECAETGAIPVMALERTTNEPSSLEKHPGDHCAGHLVDSQLDAEVVVETTNQLQVERTGQERKSRRSSRRSGTRKRRLSQQRGKLESVATASSSAECLPTSDQETESGSLHVLPVGESGQYLCNSVQPLNQAAETESGCMLREGETAPPFSDSLQLLNQEAGTESACALLVGETAPSQTNSLLVSNEAVETDSACEFGVGKTVLLQSAMALNAGGEEKRPNRKRKSNDVEGEAVCVLQDEGIAPSQVNLPLSSTSDIQVDSIIALPDAKTASSSAMDMIEYIETGAVSDLAPERVTNEELSMEKHSGDHGEHFVDSQLDTEVVVERTIQPQVERTGQKRKSRRSSRRSGARKERLSQQTRKVESFGTDFSFGEHLPASNETSESGLLVGHAVGHSEQSLFNSVQLLSQADDTESACTLPVGESALPLANSNSTQAASQKDDLASSQLSGCALSAMNSSSKTAVVTPSAAKIFLASNQASKLDPPCVLPVASLPSISSNISTSYLETDSVCGLPVIIVTPPTRSSSVVSLNQAVESVSGFQLPKTAIEPSLSGKWSASNQAIETASAGAAPMDKTVLHQQDVFLVSNQVPETEPACAFPVYETAPAQSNIALVSNHLPKTEPACAFPVGESAPTQMDSAVVSNQVPETEPACAFPTGETAPAQIDSAVVSNQLPKTEPACAFAMGETAPAQIDSAVVSNQAPETEPACALPMGETAPSQIDSAVVSKQVPETDPACASPMGETAPARIDSAVVSKQVPETDPACAFPMGETAPAQMDSAVVSKQVPETDPACAFPTGETAPAQMDSAVVSNQVSETEPACAFPAVEAAPAQFDSELDFNQEPETEPACAFPLGENALPQPSSAVLEHLIEAEPACVLPVSENGGDAVPMVDMYSCEMDADDDDEERLLPAKKQASTDLSAWQKKGSDKGSRKRGQKQRLSQAKRKSATVAAPMSSGNMLALNEEVEGVAATGSFPSGIAQDLAHAADGDSHSPKMVTELVDNLETCIVAPEKMPPNISRTGRKRKGGNTLQKTGKKKRLSQVEGDIERTEIGLPKGADMEPLDQAVQTDLASTYSPIPVTANDGIEVLSVVSVSEAFSGPVPESAVTPPSVGNVGCMRQSHEGLLGATVKTEVEDPEAVAAGANEQASASGSMDLVCYYVRAAFEALFGPNYQEQVAAVSALPPNWGQPIDERMAQAQNNRTRRRRMRRVWNGEAFVSEEERRQETAPYTRRRRGRRN